MSLMAGGTDPILRKLANCANAGDKNICRNLHRLLSSSHYTLQVEIQNAEVSIRHTRTRKLRQVPWPVMKLSSWVRHVMEDQGGQLLLAGNHISQDHLWKPVLTQFWNFYEGVDPMHPTFQHSLPRACTLPVFVHGDEGRGRSKQPVLIISFQGLLSHLGVHRLNESGLQG